MTKNDFVKNLVFYLYKDSCYSDTKDLKKKCAKLFNCQYEDTKVNDMYIQLLNYQIEKYGCTLYSTNNIKRR